VAHAHEVWGQGSGRTSATLQAALLRAREGDRVIVGVHAVEMAGYCRDVLRRLGATAEENGRIQITTHPEDAARGTGRPVFRDHMQRGHK